MAHKPPLRSDNGLRRLYCGRLGCFLRRSQKMHDTMGACRSRTNSGVSSLLDEQGAIFHLSPKSARLLPYTGIDSEAEDLMTQAATTRFVSCGVPEALGYLPSSPFRHWRSKLSLALHLTRSWLAHFSGQSESMEVCSWLNRFRGRSSPSYALIKAKLMPPMNHRTLPFSLPFQP